MVGYPGSGKSTVSKIIRDTTGAVHLWADHERRRLFARPTYSHEENISLYDAMNRMTKKLLSSGQSVVFDTSFNYYRDRENLRELAAQYEAEVLVVWVDAPKELAEERATRDAHKQNTRILGDMSHADFERMSSSLETPREGERYVKVDGREITVESVTAALESA
jgi:predicted kinase